MNHTKSTYLIIEVVNKTILLGIDTNLHISVSIATVSVNMLAMSVSSDIATMYHSCRVSGCVCALTHTATARGAQTGKFRALGPPCHRCMPLTSFLALLTFGSDIFMFRLF